MYKMSMKNNILGHSNIENQLMNSIKKNRIDNAWIISGNNGIGKATLSMKYINKIFKQYSNDEFLNKHEHLIETNSHPDLFTLYKGRPTKLGKVSKEIISIDLVREAIDFIHKTPSFSLKKILFIDSIHLMNVSAQNCLLKILEEPANNTVIIATTNRLESILPTIRSRSLILKGKDLSNEDIKKIIINEGKILDLENIDFYIEIANGSVKKTISYLENDAILIYKKILNAVIMGKQYISEVADYAIINNVNYTIISSLYSQFLFSAIKKNTCVLNKNNMLDEENKAMEVIFKRFSKKGLIKYYEYCLKSFAKVKAPFYMDKKTTILTILFKL